MIVLCSLHFLSDSSHDVIQLFLQLTARVQPRPVKRLLEERGQCSKVVQLHERAQAAPKVIEKVDTMGADLLLALVSTRRFGRRHVAPGPPSRAWHV